MTLQEQDPMRPRIKRFLVFNINPYFLFLGIWTLMVVSCTGPSPPERPRDPWVYRSVLDERPRMISIALHENLWSAYDTRYCTLYKAWQGGVNFDGAVYTTRHGVQPTTFGTTYLIDSLGSSVWSVSGDGIAQVVTPNYQGHYFKNDQVTLNYQFQYQEEQIQVAETPEYYPVDGYPGLSRTFVVEGLLDGQHLELQVVLKNLPTELSYTTTGDFQVKTKKSSTYGGLETFQITGTLALGNGTTKLETYFVISSPEQATEESLSKDALTQGADLIENNDCKTCHNQTVGTVGPSYLEIAGKYPTTDGTIRLLAGKIMTGGTGNWGEVPMTAHPDLTEPDAELMVNFILSLDNEVKDIQDTDLLLGEPGFPLTLSENHLKSTDSNIEGLSTSVYLYEDYYINPNDIISTGKPILSGVSSGIHVMDLADFGSLNSNLLVEYSGVINVSEETNVDFRLVSDDGSFLYINDRLVIDNGGFHGTQARDGEIILQAGGNEIRVVYFNGAGDGVVSLQWAPHGADKYEIVPGKQFTHHGNQIKEAVPHIPRRMLVRNIPGDQTKLTSVHPSFDLAQARPDEFQGRIGGLDFLSDGTLVVSTWDSLGPVYLLKGVQGDDPESIKVTRIATGLAEPLGLKVVDDEIYVLQKQELTKLIDHDGDGIIDEYRTVCDDWRVSANFHEFAFGLEYQEGYFYATLATAINPGGASTQPQIPDRGKAIKISKDDGTLEFIAHGLRTPNGIGTGVDDQLFIADNQGDWLPGSKIVHLQEGVWYGSRSVDFKGTEGLTETPPVVWLPQDEIGNSPSMPVAINIGPYQGQMIHGEVTHGGIKRVFVETINGQYQGAVFRFMQGLEAGVNRLVWGPDGALYVGGVGSTGNWNDDGEQWYGLQKLTYNEQVTFEMLAVRAKTNGLELEFTAPIEAGSGNRVEEYQLQQWYYLPTKNYGGPKLDLETLEINSIHISEDRKKVFLEIPELKAGHVVHVRIIQPFRSIEKQSLWTTEAWYTLNGIPSDDFGFKNPVLAQKHNTLLPDEIENGWQLLFDGKTTLGWRNFNSDQIGSAWKVRDHCLTLDNRNKVDGKVYGGGDIVTDGEYEDYELTLEWKIEKGGNSGIMYNVVEGDEYDHPWQTGPEVQILDNLRHADGRIETHRSSDLYDMIACKFVAANGPGEWNQLRLVSKAGKISHWLNGYELVTYEMHTSEWDLMVAKSKFKDMQGFGKSKRGHIALQDHGDRVWFRNIKIKHL